MADTQSAEGRREKAEKERARWEEIRALERVEDSSEAIKVDEVNSGVPGQSSPADARDLVSGEQEVRPPLYSSHCVHI